MPLNIIAPMVGGGAVLFNDATTTTLGTFLGDATSVFGKAIDWVGTVGSTIIGSPILLAFCAIPLVGVGVGLFKRLLNVN